MPENENKNEKDGSGCLVTFRFVGVGWSFDEAWVHNVRVNNAKDSFVTDAFNNFSRPKFCDLFPNVSASVFRYDTEKEAYVFYDYISADAVIGKSVNRRKGD